MKKCSNCGCDNADEAVNCRDCGKGLERPNDAAIYENPIASKSVLRKCTHCGREYPQDVLICEHDAWPLFTDPSPLKITVFTDSTTRQYSQQSMEATLTALRTDILQGIISKETMTAFETRNAKGKIKIRKGKLIDCASRYAILADLYAPVRRQARLGLLKGIFAGAFLWTLFLGGNIYKVNQDLGFMILAIAACWAILVVLATLRKFFIFQNICGIASIIITWNLGFDGGFVLTGALVAGALLLSMPGMAIGAAKAAINHSKHELAKDAPKENVALGIAIPVILSIVMWSCYLSWMNNAVRKQNNPAVASPVQRQFVGGLSPQLQYGGVYRCPDDTAVSYNNYLRFYPAGTVGVITFGGGGPQDAIRLLEEHKNDCSYMADVTNSGGTLTFSTCIEDYSGEISGDLIQVRWYNRLNRFQGTNVYEFVKFQP